MNNAILKAMSVLAVTATLAGSAYAADNNQDTHARGTLVMQGDQGIAADKSNGYDPVARATAVLPAGNVFSQAADANEGPVDGD